MSNLPEEFPEAPQPLSTPSPESPASPEPPEAALPEAAQILPFSRPDEPLVPGEPSQERPLFSHIFAVPPPPPPQERIPNLGHVAILSLLALLAIFCAGLLANVGISMHLFGVTNTKQAATDIHYTLGTEGLFYLLTLAASLLLFPHLWHKGFFDGIQWQAAAARRRSGYLFGAAAACFALALINGLLLPGPSDAPIDKLFRMPGAAWTLFLFGVTFAPFFEEMAFRGFLLPALSTAFDWAAERSTGSAPHALDRNGHPQWSLPAMIAASIITSLLFGLLHAEQTGYALGPFLLLVCVSMVLCGIRLLLRSLAASVLVHASYNFLLFTLMFLGTAGFRHLDNM